MQNITEFIKKEMEARGMTYELLASRAGMSRQNLWDKLNKRVRPSFETTKKILEGMDFILLVKKREQTKETEKIQQEFFEIAEEEQISYEVAERLLAVMGYELVTIVEDTETHDNE